MISIYTFKNSDTDIQAAEIEYTSKLLELSYRAYEFSPMQTMRGQIWKLEKLLTLFLYLHK